MEEDSKTQPETTAETPAVEEKSPLVAHAEQLLAAEDPSIWLDDPVDSDSGSVEAPESPAEPEEVAEVVPEQEGQEETFTPDEPATAPEPDRFEEKFAALAKREKEVRELAEGVKQQQKMLELAKDRPMEFLSQLGWDYDTLTAHHVSGQQAVPTETAVQQTNQELRKLQEKIDALETARAQEKVNSAKSKYMSNIRETLENNPQKFGLTLAFADDPASLVFDAVERTYTSEQRILSPEEATQLVEQDIQKRIERSRSADWFQREILKKQAAEREEQAPAKKPGASKASGKTLTNDLSAEQQPEVDLDDLLGDDSALMDLARKQLLRR